MVTGDRSAWAPTTHRWESDADRDHLEAIRRSAEEYAPTGTLHLVLEVVAYAADEARASSRLGHCEVVLHSDGSISITDDGRGTDTRRDVHGRPVRKPVMSTADLRFAAGDHRATLADGQPRRGMSVVAALSTWVVHLNRRVEEAWSQRYQHGVPVGDLASVAGDGRTGTTVHFLPDPSLVAPLTMAAEDLARLMASDHLAVGVRTETG